MSVTLKPCPFCGRSIYAHFEGDPPRCDCDIRGAYFSMQENDWNTRPIEDALTAERDALKADLASETAWAKQYSDRALTFQAENNDLREALEKITRAGGRSTPLSDKIQNIARAALKK